MRVVNGLIYDEKAAAGTEGFRPGTLRTAGAEIDAVSFGGAEETAAAGAETEQNRNVNANINANANGTVAAAENEPILDATGCYVIPGLLDLHFHGCVGEDFSDASPEGLAKMAAYELSQGVTYICPAGMTLPEEQLDKICRNAAQYRAAQNKSAQDRAAQNRAVQHQDARDGAAEAEGQPGAELVGINLEGPFLSEGKKGAQNPDYLHKPDTEMLERLLNSAQGLVRLITVAPELPGALPFIETAAKRFGLTVSVGHTEADYDTAMAAFQAGASQATHLYNGMPPLHHRAPGVIGAAFDAEGVRAELICDGVHIHPAVIRMTFQLFGRDRVILISDSLRAAGMPDGQYPFGGQEIEVHGNRATLLGKPETLAGSVTNLMGCLREAVSFGIPLADAVRAASTNPAKALGLFERIGSLDAGKDASFVLLNKADFSVKSIVFHGKLLSSFK